MSRLPLLAWFAALAAAAFSTYELWRICREPVEVFTGVGSGGGDEGLPFGFVVTPLLGDAYAVAGLAMLWAVPSALVVAGFLTAYGMPGRAAAAGRRTAGLLVLISVAAPLSPYYFDAEACELVPALSGRWFALAGGAWGAQETSLLVAALLVLLATQTTGEVAAESLTGRRAAAFVIDYLIVVTLATIAGGESLVLGNGVLNQAELLHQNPAAVLLLPVAVVYALAGRTFGKRIMRIEVVARGTGRWPGWRRAAVRALVFPGLVLLPEFGLVALAVDALWWLVDGHPLHDRLSGTAVKRTEKDLVWR